MEAMIRRDRNHPSIILWGMGNESQHRRAYVALGKIIHELDPGRPSTYAENHIYRARRARTLGVPDVWGLNYEVEALDEVREHCRTGSVVVAEACNQQAERGDTAAERMQIEAIEEFWRAIDGKPYVAGYTLWAYNDYPTMFRERYTRYTGKFDAWRLPKLAAYLFEARYAKTPFIRLVGAWGGVPEGTAVELDVFTNCQRVELSRGGPTIELEPGEFHRTIEVPYSAHPISATVHHSGGASSSRLRPFGNAAALTAYAIPVGVPEEGWFDLRLAVVDAGKEVVTGWRGEVRLGFSGPVRLVPLTAEGGVLVSRGRGRSFARRLAGGSVVVVAWADGLEAARIEIPDQGPVTSSTHRMPELLTTP
jgi:beta-galactosidase